MEVILIMAPLFVGLGLFTLFYLVVELLLAAAHDIWSAATDD